MKHTPGPWKVKNGSYCTIIEAETGKRIGAAWSDPDTPLVEAIENARLFAAAPELLNMLALALPYVESQIDEPGYKPHVIRRFAAEIRKLIERVDGVEGRSNG